VFRSIYRKLARTIQRTLRPNGTQRPRKVWTTRPRLEALEDRLTPGMLTVQLIAPPPPPNTFAPLQNAIHAIDTKLRGHVSGALRHTIHDILVDAEQLGRIFDPGGLTLVNITLAFNAAGARRQGDPALNNNNPGTMPRGQAHVVGVTVMIGG
jgi:hypothetical protein